MKYLSFDIEATGLREEDYVIEFGMVPFDTEKGIENRLSKHFFVKCPPFENLREELDQWVLDHNEGLIRTASAQGLSLSQFKSEVEEYVCSRTVQNYFFPGGAELKEREKIILFGKSLNAIDLPFLNRDLGWNFMRQHFSHRVLDLTSVVIGAIDLNFLPADCISGTKLMQYFSMGEVEHTALEDAINTAALYLKILEKFKVKTNV